MNRGYLLDTNVVSATAPQRRPTIDPAIGAARAWVLANDGALFLPAIAIAEIGVGIGHLEASGADRKAGKLAEWLATTVQVFAERIREFDTEAALRTRMLARAARSAGIAPGFADLAVAAIALRHDLVIATRNTRHFTALGVTTIDPFVA